MHRMLVEFEISVNRFTTVLLKKVSPHSILFKVTLGFVIVTVSSAMSFNHLQKVNNQKKCERKCN